MIKKFLDDVSNFLSQVIEVSKKIISIAVPIGAAMILCDLLLGTNFNVTKRLVEMLALIGFSGNFLRNVIVVISVVVVYNHVKKQ